ncbi:MAG: Amidase [Glaciihabitans sp.]|nr:Amidase [Glaciihabitans sp.]
MSAEPGGGYLTISDALTALRAGETTAAALMESAISAADAHNSALGIYMSRFDATALEAAYEADTAYATGDPVGALAGIPLGIKDIITSTEGPTTAQSLVHDSSWGDQLDAPVVARLRAAGGLITGKTTTMEFATGVPDLTKPFPVPRNPWNLENWTGGSSSGTGNGVAAGAFLGGLGTDTGGSIRMPAAFCGISGIKATFGRVPKSGCVPLGYSLDHIGPMARSAMDCAIMLSALAGYDASDPTTVEEPVPDYTLALGGDLAGLRIGVDSLQRFVVDGDSAVAERFEKAIESMVALGATIVPVSLPYYREVAAAARITSRSEAFAYHALDMQTRWDEYFAATRQGVGSSPFNTGADYVQAQRVRRVGQKAMAELFSTVDIILTPMASTEAPTIGSLAKSFGDRFALVHAAYWNGLGNPALSVPMGAGETGLPLGLQVIGKPFDEATVLKVGDAFQQITDFHLAVAPMISGTTTGFAVAAA